MKIFLDANVIVAVLNKEYPLFEYAAKVLSLADRDGFELYVSPLSVAIAFYFVSKKSGPKQAKLKLAQMLEHLSVSNVNHEMTRSAMVEPKVLDVEDGIQYFSAMHHQCQFIITENVGDFHFSRIPVMKADDFLKEVKLG